MLIWHFVSVARRGLKAFSAADFLVQEKKRPVNNDNAKIGSVVFFIYSSL
jgi:hypothetical protein